jgi:hypothetical protein
MCYSSLLVLIFATYVGLFLRREYLSFYAMGIHFLFIYSIPMLWGFGKNFTSSALYQIPNSVYLVYIIIWLPLCFYQFFLCSNLKKNRYPFQLSSIRHLKYINYFILLTLLLYLYYKGYLLHRMALDENSKDSMVEIVRNIFRWSLVSSAFFSGIAGSVRERFLIVTIIFIWILSGDRTIPVMALVGLLIGYTKYNDLKPVNERTSPVVLLTLGSISTILVLISKVIYSNWRSDAFIVGLRGYKWGENLYSILVTNFEPMVIITHLTSALTKKIPSAPIDTIAGAVFEITILPSFVNWDIDTYNERLLSALNVNLSYGVAGNIWADIIINLSLAVIPIVVLLYCHILRRCDVVIAQNRYSSQFLLLFGILCLVYLHRNDMGNFSIFVKQIIVYSLICSIINKFKWGSRTNHAPT